MKAAAVDADTPPERDDSGAAGADDGAGLGRPLVALAVAAGALLRVAALAGGPGLPDADEAIAGLMARDVLEGRGWPAFFWGQEYGGTAQLGPLALSRWLLGPSLPGLRVPTLLLAAANGVLVWRIAHRLMPPRPAQLAGLLMWVGAPAALWYGTREMLFYQPTVFLGLVLALCVLGLLDDSAVDDSAVTLRWLLAGLCAGVGWWVSPNIVYFVVPSAIVAAWRVVRGPRPVPWRGPLVATAGAALGASVWITANAASDLASMDARSTFPVVGTYLSRLEWFASTGLPAQLGLREVFFQPWILGALGVAAYLAVLVPLGFATAQGLRRCGWDAVGLVVFPFIFARIPFGPDTPNNRYLFFLVPFLALVLARLARSRRIAVVMLAAAMTLSALNVAGLHRLASSGPPGLPATSAIGDVGPVIDALDRRRITRVFADYWVAYVITFRSDERVIAASSAGLERYPRYTGAVRSAARPAWVVVHGPQYDAMVSALRSLGVDAEVEHAGDFAIVVPGRPVMPEELPPAARSPSR
jgi:4-amino-4-deoxy-L-arabinose transferase-like glycosyltransferase